VYAGMKASDAAGIAMLSRRIAAETRGGDRPRLEILGLKGPWQNASMVLKFENTLGYNPLRIDDYGRAVGPGQDAEDFALRHYPGTFRGYNSRLAALLGLQYLVLDRPLTELPREIPRPKADEVFASGGLYIYKLGKTAPRVYFSASVKPVESDDVLDEQVLPDFDYKSEVLIEQASLADLHGGPYPLSLGQEPIQTAGLGNDQTAGQAAGRAARAESSDAQDQRAAIVNYTDNRVEIDVDAPRAGIVVLHDLFYPGWEVRVDGHEQPVLRANILFRGAEVPAGHHHIVFSFRPLSLTNLTAAAYSVLHRQEE
jgi:Bacterial membrane protein YfhO